VSYRTLTFPLGRVPAETIERICEDLGALSVTFSDAHDEPVLEPAPGEVRLWRETVVQALLEASPADEWSKGSGAPREAMLRAALVEAGIADSTIAVGELAERIWEREWLRDFHARRFGSRLWVCPRHEKVAEPGAAVVMLDPGLAFGTGHHPSTALCLEWLDANIQGGESMMDYGCGSGLLGIAALKLGARIAHGFDIDPQALLASAENATENGVRDRFSLHAEAASLPRVDVLVANILSGVLIELAPRLAGLVDPGGNLVVAGLMVHESNDVTSAYQPWFDIGPAATHEDWACLQGKRRA